MKYLVVAALALAGCAATSGVEVIEPGPSAESVRIDTQLARFMREAVNVPFSFAVMERDGRRRAVRFRRAALVLQDAVRDLVHWEDPPAKTVSARVVFYTYARELERQVGALELAARSHDVAATSAHLEQIRETCNSCHHFFRPASVISEDVLRDRFAAELEEGP
ncbi:MAG: cytochrome c [Kofleriaceae bacterium]|nr:cytochrome c [Kofleriaceae bacterium]